jgi:hypothetical protein
MDASLHIAQQLGNGAIVKMLHSGRSFFGVRARGEGSKGYAEKGTPTKIFDVRVWQRLATTEKTQRIEACEHPLIGLMN